MRARRIPCADALQLWHIDLDAPGSAALSSCLSSDERERSRRFVFESDRDRFIAARGALRKLLADAVARPPEMLRFDYGAFGKPALAGELVTTHFNLSHSGADALVVITDRHAVGVDVELLRDMPDTMALASSCFTAAECNMLRNMRQPAQSQAFLTCWTRKEACLKAIGSGLDIDPRNVEVGILPTRQTVRLTTADIAIQVQVHSFTYLNRMICAVARVSHHSVENDPASTEQEFA